MRIVKINFKTKDPLDVLCLNKIIALKIPNEPPSIEIVNKLFSEIRVLFIFARRLS